MKYGADVYVTRAENIPTREHWAIITSSQYTTEESGAWAPGHGYPASTENFINYAAYFDEERFLTQLKRDLASVFGPRVRGIHVDQIYTGTVGIEVTKTV